MTTVYQEGKGEKIDEELILNRANITRIKKGIYGEVIPRNFVVQ